MTRELACLMLAALTLAALPHVAAAQDADPAPGVPPKAVKEHAGTPDIGVAEETGAPPPPALPRRLRWQRMQVAYVAANVRHPALYGDNPAEKVTFDDAAIDHCGKTLALAFCEYVHFGATLAASPVLAAMKPPWTCESVEP